MVKLYSLNYISKISAPPIYEEMRDRIVELNTTLGLQRLDIRLFQDMIKEAADEALEL